LIGWANMIDSDGTEIAYNADGLEDILTIFEAIELMRAAVEQLPTAAEKNLRIAIGLLDQAAWFIHAARFAMNEAAYWKKKLKNMV